MWLRNKIKDKLTNIFKLRSCEKKTKMDGRSLERELIQVVRTVEQLQRKYLDLLLGEEAGEEVGDTLDDYLQLCERLSDWLQQTDAATRVSCLVHRAMVRCTETSHASLLLPVLKLLQQGLTEAGECEVASQNPPTLPKLAVNLANKVGLAVEALESSSNDSVVYSRREARSVADICTRLLSIICQVNTDATRVVLERQADFREQLAKFLARQESLACRNVLEAVESEEECMRGEERRMEATLLIQATYRMYKQRQWWGKLRQGAVALQQLARKRKKRSMNRSGGKESWLTELESVADRREKLERRFRRIQKLDPNKLDGFLQVEREVAATKIQSWWKRLRPRRLVEVEEKEEEVRKDKAAEVIQAAVRRWLEARQSSPAWSKLLQPRVISEERARELRRQIEVCWTRHLASVSQLIFVKLNK